MYLSHICCNFLKAYRYGLIKEDEENSEGLWNYAFSQSTYEKYEQWHYEEILIIEFDMNSRLLAWSSVLYSMMAFLIGFLGDNAPFSVIWSLHLHLDFPSNWMKVSWRNSFKNHNISSNTTEYSQK